MDAVTGWVLIYIATLIGFILSCMCKRCPLCNS